MKTYRYTIVFVGGISLELDSKEQLTDFDFSVNSWGVNNLDVPGNILVNPRNISFIKVDEKRELTKEEVDRIAKSPNPLGVRKPATSIDMPDLS